MDEIIDLAVNLRSKIDELPEMQEYLKLKNIFENNKELEQMRRDIARLKSLGKIDESNNLLKIYNSHPLVNNFYIAKDEAKKILQTISDIIQ